MKLQKKLYISFMQQQVQETIGSNNTKAVKLSAEQISKSRGCIIGALCGDALGAVLEFKRNLQQSDVVEAFKMQGGGCHRVGPGQITDDGELTLSLLAALSRCKKGFDIEEVCKSYRQWFESQPFDIGRTTRNSISKGTYKLCREAALSKNMTSESNGSLMLISPLADIKTIVDQVTNITHPSELVHLCNLFYVTCITLLLKNNITRMEAYLQTKALITTKNATFLDWLSEIENPSKRQNPKISEGWIRIAFTWSFGIFLDNQGYADSIAFMLSQGGDTDTNACILGGLLGAALGEQGIDEAIRQKLFAFDGKSGRLRPQFLVPKNVFDQNLEILLNNIT